MATNGIHGNLLLVTVSSCNNLKDTEWISRQDPYVCVEYANDRSRTRTCTDGGKNPMFQDRFRYTLIEGLRELKVNVWNSNNVRHDVFIGSGKIQLAKALSHGFDDSTWPLQSKSGRHAGEIRLIIEYTNINKPASNDALQYGAPQASFYSVPQPHPSVSYPPIPPVGAIYPPAGGYPAPSSYHSYPLNLGVYPPLPYPPQGAYYAPQLNSTYPALTYGSQQQHPPPYGTYPPGPSYPGAYPPPY